MGQQVFERIEKKYLLTKSQYQGLMKELGGKLEGDVYGKHTISNLYFDTENYELIRRSIEKPVYKEKLRLRAYGQVEEDSTVFAELKKKCSGIVYKRRVAMSLSQAYAFLIKGEREEDCQILREIRYVMEQYRLRPMAYIAYDRTAFSSREDGELRMTFDRDIRCRSWNLDIRQTGHNIPILGEDEILMEVKLPGAMPVWMCQALSRQELYPVSYSKYGTYYKQYLWGRGLRREKEEDHCA